MRFVRLWPIAAYLAAFSALGWYVYDTVDGMIMLAAEALPMVFIATLIAIPWASARKKPINWSGTAVLAAVVCLTTSMRERVEDAVDGHRLRREVAHVDLKELPAALHQSDTRLGGFLGDLLPILKVGQARQSAIYADANDPAITRALDHTALADPAKRQAALSAIGKKLIIIEQMPPRLQDVVEDERRKAIALVNADTDLSPGMRTEFLVPFNQAVDTAPLKAATYLSALKTTYDDFASLLVFLDSDIGAPTLSPQGNMLLKNQQAVEIFNVKAQRVDSDRRVVAQVVQTMREQASIDNLKKVLTN